MRVLDRADSHRRVDHHRIRIISERLARKSANALRVGPHHYGQVQGDGAQLATVLFQYQNFGKQRICHELRGTVSPPASSQENTLSRCDFHLARTSSKPSRSPLLINHSSLPIRVNTNGCSHLLLETTLIFRKTVYLAGQPTTHHTQGHQLIRVVMFTRHSLRQGRIRVEIAIVDQDRTLSLRLRNHCQADAGRLADDVGSKQRDIRPQDLLRHIDQLIAQKQVTEVFVLVVDRWKVLRTPACG